MKRHFQRAHPRPTHEAQVPIPDLLVKSEPSIINEAHFQRMACGDVPGFIELAREFFADIRTRTPLWPELLEDGQAGRLREEFHRCKGGAAIFGFERLVKLLGSWEMEYGVENGAVNLDCLERELAAAEKAIAEHQS